MQDELIEVLRRIAEHTDPEPDGENYRMDDPEGCLDTVFAIATAAIAKATAPTPPANP